MTFAMSNRITVTLLLGSSRPQTSLDVFYSCCTFSLVIYIATALFMFSLINFNVL